MAFVFDSDQDWGPYETLFNAYQNYTVKITTNSGHGADARVDYAGRDYVVVTLTDDDGVPQGKTKKIAFEDITKLLVY